MRAGALSRFLKGVLPMKKLSLVALGVASAAVATPALAQNAVDYSTLTSAVDFSTAITAIMSVAAIVALVLVARKGIRFVLGAIR